VEDEMTLKDLTLEISGLVTSIPESLNSWNARAAFDSLNKARGLFDELQERLGPLEDAAVRLEESEAQSRFAKTAISALLRARTKGDK
jgi:hypothetical protein